MTVQDLRKWLSSREEEDVWWIQIAGETLGRKVNLGKIEQILDENLDSEVMVLHVSQATQRPRPWVEVERVKAAPVEKPRNEGVDGRQRNGTHSDEREPCPVRNFDFDSSRGSRDQTPVSVANPQSDLPTPSAPPAQRKKNDVRQWYYLNGGQQYGPFGESDLVAMFKSGKLTPDTMVWNEELENWIPACEVNGLVLVIEPLAQPPASQPPTIVSSGASKKGLPSGKQRRPWVRFLARKLDYSLFTLLGLALLALGFAILGGPLEVFLILSQFLGFILFFPFVFAEAAMLAAWGTTPGKEFFKIRLRNCDGSRLSYADALNRSIKVWFRGNGMGIPLVITVCSLLAYARLMEKGTTSWDEQGAFKVTHQPVGAGRTVIVILVVVAWFAIALIARVLQNRELAELYG